MITALFSMFGSQPTKSAARKSPKSRCLRLRGESLEGRAMMSVTPLQAAENANSQLHLGLSLAQVEAVVNNAWAVYGTNEAPSTKGFSGAQQTFLRDIDPTSGPSTAFQQAMQSQFLYGSNTTWTSMVGPPSATTNPVTAINPSYQPQATGNSNSNHNVDTGTSTTLQDLALVLLIEELF